MEPSPLPPSGSLTGGLPNTIPPLPSQSFVHSGLPPPCVDQLSPLFWPHPQLAPFLQHLWAGSPWGQAGVVGPPPAGPAALLAPPGLAPGPGAGSSSAPSLVSGPPPLSALPAPQPVWGPLGPGGDTFDRLVDAAVARSVSSVLSVLGVEGLAPAGSKTIRSVSPPPASPSCAFPPATPPAPPPPGMAWELFYATPSASVPGPTLLLSSHSPAGSFSLPSSPSV